jgi:hypothetical protein
MRKLIIAFFASIFAIGVFGQNLQLHYDFGKGRSYLTTTVEKFSPDKYGSTFFFVDFNYSKSGPTEAYWEIARELKNWDAPFSVHVEYNGGLNRVIPLAINNAYLVGGTYSWNASDFSKGFSLSAMYKNIQGNTLPHNFQLTGVWYLNMLKGKVSFSGFADFWKEENTFLGTSFVFLSEPQLWYNFNKSFSAGGEVELGYNFAGVKGFNACPTLAAKWSF